MSVDPEKPRFATSFDVARRAGVSRGAVSQILNGRVARFPPETQLRVIKAAEELDYRPSPAGALLSTGRSNIIVVLLPTSTYGPAVQDGIDHIVTLASARGLEVVLSTAAPPPLSTLKRALGLHPAAIVDVGGLLGADDRARAEKAGVAVVPHATRSLGPDGEFNRSIGALMARTLITDGRQHLAYIALDDQRDDLFGPTRYQGMREETERHGLPAPVRASVPLVLEGAATVVASLFADTAGFGAGCFNDDVAIAVLAAARHLDLKVPDQISIVGVDHTQLGQLVDPPLTSIDTRIANLIDLVVEELPMLTADRPPTPHVSASNVQPQLVKGATTRR